MSGEAEEAQTLSQSWVSWSIPILLANLLQLRVAGGQQHRLPHCEIARTVCFATPSLATVTRCCPTMKHGFCKFDIEHIHSWHLCASTVRVRHVGRNGTHVHSCQLRHFDYEAENVTTTQTITTETGRCIDGDYMPQSMTTHRKSPRRWTCVD